jgi:hypothetical protein
MTANDYPVVLNGGPVDADLWFNPVAQDLTATRAQVAANNAPWFDYTATFTLTASIVNPTQGNSVYRAEYLGVSAELIKVRIRIDVGSTFNAGNGVYGFLLPFPASLGAIGGSVGNVYILDTGTAIRQAVGILVDATHINIYLNGAAVAIGSAGSGTAWATGDVIQINMDYEPA